MQLSHLFNQLKENDDLKETYYLCVFLCPFPRLVSCTYLRC